MRQLVLGYKSIFILTSLITTFIVLVLSNTTMAALLANRSITLSTAQPSATARHTYQFTYGSVGTVGSVVFEYCSNSPVFSISCNAPAGLDVASAVLTNQTGNTGFSIDSVDTTLNKLVITRPPSAGGIVPSSYVFDNITNPSTPSASQFVRISTYSSTDGSGAYTDNGAVAFATPAPFNIGASVPPFLRLCAAITVAPDCSSMFGDSLDLGNLTTSAAKAGTSQFAVGTNAVNGYIVFILGTTMTSGNNAISALSIPTPSFPGNNQFGLNLRGNTIPSVGADPFGAGTGSPAAAYNIPNQYLFNNGDTITTSALPSDFNRMTVSYVTNINSAQPPGIYTTTFTFLATANF